MQDANFSQIDGVIPQEIVEPSSVSEVQSMLDQAVKKNCQSFLQEMDRNFQSATHQHKLIY
ncbi:TPA: hypothetical protein EYO77_15480 [Candidatus Poribacteria bacterium]|nr:hypothetical protein [Candidatus Poribacteria bacterium]